MCIKGSLLRKEGKTLTELGIAPSLRSREGVGGEFMLYRQIDAIKAYARNKSASEKTRSNQ